MVGFHLLGGEMLQTCYQHNQRQHDFELKGLFLKPYWKVKSINVGQDKRCDTALTAVGDKMQKKKWEKRKRKYKGLFTDLLETLS